MFINDEAAQQDQTHLALKMNMSSSMANRTNIVRSWQEQGKKLDGAEGVGKAG